MTSDPTRLWDDKVLQNLFQLELLGFEGQSSGLKIGCQVWGNPEIEESTSITCVG